MINEGAVLFAASSTSAGVMSGVVDTVTAPDALIISEHAVALA
ncbi:MAG: hypothetical protein OEV40_31990 [Acidimicrobiia bacterium]|nr:hypothetical protein [Acidimicrobiia bacterium]